MGVEHDLLGNRVRGGTGSEQQGQRNRVREQGQACVMGTGEQGQGEQGHAGNRVRLA